ncbi:hypothetical protein [Turicibacter bilis]|uniref:hypothetical protein n=1 Tax=Turicibacter bilis TaxID=2735723 RepID=UPI003F8A4F79
MIKKYVLSILTLLMVFSCIRVDAKSVDSYDSYTKLVNPYKVNKNEEEFINVEFDDSFFTLKIKASNGEIIECSELSKTTKTMTDKDLVQMIIDSAELIYGKDSKRYELNKDKFTTLLEEGNFNYSDFISFQDKPIQARYELHKEKDKFMNITFNHSEFSVAVRASDGEITGTGRLPELNMTDEKLTQMIIDCAELLYGKDSERYELNKDKFTALLEEGGMHYYD